MVGYTAWFNICFIFRPDLLPQQGFVPDGQNPRRHPTSPRVYREENFAVAGKISIFENTARKGLPKSTQRIAESSLGVE